MTVSQLMNEEKLKLWILRRLGSPLVKIELTPEHLDDAIDSAKRWFADRKGVQKLMNIPLISGTPDYQLADDVDTVLDVVFPENNADLTLIFSPYLLIDEKVPYDVFAAPNSAGLYSTFTQTLQYVEMAKRVLSADSEWHQEGRTLYLSPVPRYTGQLIIFYKSHQFTVEQLSERDHNYVKLYSLAWAKQDLGRVRSKYPDGFPAAEGLRQLDGEKLLAEAEKDMEKLDKSIVDTAMPMPVLRG
jgi:hypothetical protein